MPAFISYRLPPVPTRMSVSQAAMPTFSPRCRHFRHSSPDADDCSSISFSFSPLRRFSRCQALLLADAQIDPADYSIAAFFLRH